jgi:HK97 family phage major capsid protein
MKTLAERIAALEAEIAPKRKRMEAIQKAADDDGERDLNESEAQEFDELRDELIGLNVKLGRLKSLANSSETARPVTGDRPRTEAVPAEVRKPVEKGIGFARYVMCFAAAKGNRFEAIEIAKQRYPHDRNLPLVLRAPVSGGTTTEADWASALVDPTTLTSEFIEWLRPQTVVGRFGTNGIPDLRRVPFNVRVAAQNAGGSADWVGEGKAKPVTKFGFEAVTLRWNKVAAISVLSEDLLRFSSPSAELLVRNGLSEVIVEVLDTSFIRPAFGPATDDKPASPFFGVTNTPSLGIDAAAIRADIRTAITHFIANNIPTSGLVVLMRHAQALSLSLMRNPLGVKEFPDMTMNGGMLEGLPVIASQHATVGVVGFLSANDVYLADDGGVAIDMSREASLEMSSTPTMKMGDSVGSPYEPTAAQLVSMFQTNSVALRAERIITWKKRRTAAAYYLTNVGWGNADTSPPQNPI